MRRTIRSSREIDAMFQEGVRAATRSFVLLARQTPDKRGPMGRVAVVAGRKTGPAVTRNRAKRILREAVRRTGGPWATWDVVLIARPALLRASARDVETQMRAALAEAGVLGG